MTAPAGYATDAARDRARSIEEGARAHYRDARYYDQTYRCRAHDVRWYVDLALRHRGPVLELGAGTGRVALALARRGIEVVAVDRMASMIRRGRERLAREPRRVRDRVTWVRADLRRLRLGRRFPLVIAPFNVFMHLYSRRDVERALRVVREHLTARGLFAFDVLLPDPGELARHPDRVYRGRPFRHPSDGRTYRYAERFAYDHARQVQFVTIAFQDVARPGRIVEHVLSHRQFFPRELEALLHYNGFRVLAHWGGFGREALDASSVSQVLVTRPIRGDRRGRDVG
ncbi:MAG: methyltransferase domain-containing protein [Myxococcales bacterium]|nr:methyltransferase domain-containing protein [Myxococcales bacterium]